MKAKYLTAITLRGFDCEEPRPHITTPEVLRPGQLFGLVLKKFRRNWVDYGWWITLKKSLGRTVLFPFFERTVYRIYRAELHSIQVPEVDPPAGFEFRLLGPGDDALIQQIENQAEWLAGTLKLKISGRDMCLVALNGSEVIGFNLIAVGGVYIPLLHATRKFRTGHAWSEHLAVRADYRRKGIASCLKYRIFGELRRCGVKRLYGGSRHTNLPALELARKLGSVEIADVEYLRIFTIRAWRYHRVRRLLQDNSGFQPKTTGIAVESYLKFRRGRIAQFPGECPNPQGAVARSA